MAAAAADRRVVQFPRRGAQAAMRRRLLAGCGVAAVTGAACRLCSGVRNVAHDVTDPTLFGGLQRRQPPAQRHPGRERPPQRHYLCRLIQVSTSVCERRAARLTF
jgi:hypothetical protein